MAKLILILGSNAKDKAQQLKGAEELISGMIGKIFTRSSVYETEPWGFDSQDTFFNRVLEVQTQYSPLVCMDKCLQIEKQRGRLRSNIRYESRLIDIDLLFYENKIISLEELTIPHPRLHLRRFVLEPLNELMPDYMHPIIKKCISDLLKECDDRCWVRKIL